MWFKLLKTELLQFKTKQNKHLYLFVYSILNILDILYSINIYYGDYCFYKPQYSKQAEMVMC